MKACSAFNAPWRCSVSSTSMSLRSAEDEAEQAQDLQSRLEAALESNAPIPAIWLAAAGAYFPLHTLNNAAALLGRSWPQSVQTLLIQQITEPAEEQRLRATMPALTAIEGDVSRIVREQYEENPYPRWSKAGPPVLPPILESRPTPIADALIAGCGTGFFTLDFARPLPARRFLRHRPQFVQSELRQAHGAKPWAWRTSNSRMPTL